jgi:hypothetical protein
MRAHSILRSAAGVLLVAFTAAPARACVRFGLEAGLNEAKVTRVTEFSMPGPAYRPAWSAGLTLDVPLTAKIALATGLRYVEYGEPLAISIVSVDGGASFERHLVWRYLAVPARVRVRPFPLPGLYLAAGPEAGYLLTAWHQDRFTSAPVPMSSPPEIAAVRPQSGIFEDVGSFFADPRGAYSRWNLALSGALGWEVPLAGHSAHVEARYTHGLLDIAKSETVKRSTRGLELLAGWRW